MAKKPQPIIIASDGQRTSILCDGEVYWSEPITEIKFYHRAGENASTSITCSRLPVVPDEDERVKDNFRRWLKHLMGDFLTEDGGPEEKQARGEMCTNSTRIEKGSVK